MTPQWACVGCVDCTNYTTLQTGRKWMSRICRPRLLLRKYYENCRPNEIRHNCNICDNFQKWFQHDFPLNNWHKQVNIGLYHAQISDLTFKTRNRNWNVWTYHDAINAYANGTMNIRRVKVRKYVLNFIRQAF